MSYFEDEMNRLDKKFKGKEFVLYIKYLDILDKNSIKKNIKMLGFEKLSIAQIDGEQCVEELKELNITMLPVLIHINKDNEQKQYALVDFNKVK